MEENTADLVEGFLLQHLGDGIISSKSLRTKMNERIKGSPDSAAAYMVRAFANYNLDDFPAAIRDASQVIDFCSDSYLPWHIRGASYWQSQEPEKAEVDLSESIRLSGSVNLWLEDSYRFRGGIRCNAKRAAEAIDDLTRCLDLDPEDSWAFVFRGNAYCISKQYHSALNDYEQAVSIDEDDPYLVSTLSWLLATCPDDAIRDGHRALELAEHANAIGDDGFHDDLAVARAELGDFAGAVKAQELALRQCDDMTERLRLQERLSLFESGEPYRSCDDD
jgi:tetratricopeptide (TPR) repeat protein